LQDRLDKAELSKLMVTLYISKAVIKSSPLATMSISTYEMSLFTMKGQGILPLPSHAVLIAAASRP